MEHLHAVILAGGSGTRFWPLSRRDRPKQLLPLVAEESMVRLTARRLEGLVPPERRLALTSQRYGKALAKELEGLVPAGGVVTEPVPRDTGPAAILGTLLVAARDPDGVVALLPADHVVRPTEVFQETLVAAAERASAAPVLVTFGIPPDRPATGYGYIERAEAVAQVRELTFFRAAAFREKPDLHTARVYVASGRHYWNSGMFVWQARTFLSVCQEVAPEVAAPLVAAFRGGQAPGAEALAEAFAACPRISVDYAVLEKASSVEVAPAPFVWDDVGSWAAVERHRPRDAAGNVAVGLVHLQDTERTTIVSSGDHLVAALGVKELVVVHTPDCTLVAHRDRVEEVKALVEALRARGLEERL